MICNELATSRTTVIHGVFLKSEGLKSEGELKAFISKGDLSLLT